MLAETPIKKGRHDNSWHVTRQASAPVAAPHKRCWSGKSRTGPDTKTCMQAYAHRHRYIDTLNYITSRYITPHYITLGYIQTYTHTCIALHCIALHCIASIQTNTHITYHYCYYYYHYYHYSDKHIYIIYDIDVWGPRSNDPTNPSACPGRRSRSCIAQVTQRPAAVGNPLEHFSGPLRHRFKVGVGTYVCQLTMGY